MIAIPNMEMPKGCLDCPVNDMACELWTEVVNIKENRHPACPLIEIDDELFKKAESAYVLQQIRYGVRNEDFDPYQGERDRDENGDIY